MEVDNINKDIIEKWIKQKRKEYKTEQSKWKKDGSFYYAFSEKINVLDELEKYSDKIFKVIKGKRHLNLLLLNYLLLVDNGVKKENIDYFPFCTYCDNSRFFSFRHGKINHRVDLEEMFSFIMIS